MLIQGVEACLLTYTNEKFSLLNPHPRRRAYTTPKYCSSDWLNEWWDHREELSEDLDAS